MLSLDSIEYTLNEAIIKMYRVPGESVKLNIVRSQILQHDFVRDNVQKSKRLAKVIGEVTLKLLQLGAIEKPSANKKITGLIDAATQFTIFDAKSIESDSEDFDDDEFKIEPLIVQKVQLINIFDCSTCMIAESESKENKIEEYSFEIISDTFFTKTQYRSSLKNYLVNKIKEKFQSSFITLYGIESGSANETLIKFNAKSFNELQALRMWLVAFFLPVRNQQSSLPHLPSRP